MAMIFTLAQLNIITLLADLVVDLGGAKEVNVVAKITKFTLLWTHIVQYLPITTVSTMQTLFKFDHYIEQNKIVHDLIVASKTQYYKDTLNGANTKTIYRTLNSLLNKSSTILPSSSSGKALSNRFADFFTDKIDAIRDVLDKCSVVNVNSNVSHAHDNCNIGSDNSNNVSNEPEVCNSSVDGVNMCTNFTPVDEIEVRKIISKIPSKSSSLDPMPTWLLKECVDVLTPFLTCMINNSFIKGLFPSVLRQAVITPLIKKANLDPDILKNYRPVSNLSTLGKILENPAVSRLNEHLHSKDLTDKFQSAYKSAHSTETALLKVKSDIIQELGNGKIVMLVLLDMSAAFDTIDHSILVNRLKSDYGIDGPVLNWFNSYITNRSSRVCVLGEYSSNHPLKYGVPQGSIAGPPIMLTTLKYILAIPKCRVILIVLSVDLQVVLPR